MKPLPKEMSLACPTSLGMCRFEVEDGIWKIMKVSASYLQEFRFQDSVFRFRWMFDGDCIFFPAFSAVFFHSYSSFR
jgi:hypothetical protein